MKLRLFRPMRQKLGQAPGTIIYAGPPQDTPVQVAMLQYDAGQLQEEGRLAADQVAAAGTGVTWVNCDGIHDAEIVKTIGQRFGLHALTLEDIVHPGQRPKIEVFDNYIYAVVKMLRLDDEGRIEAEQVSFVLGNGWLLTFQERPGDVFELIRDRLRQGAGQVRRLGADYLCYALLDAIVDNYFVVLESLSEQAEALQEQFSNGDPGATIGPVHALRHELMLLRRAAWPLRELVGGIQKLGVDRVSADTRYYLADLYDHVFQVAETVETLREVVANLVDLYLSTAAQRTNEVMKVLTLVATLFIPLTFIAGIYGMNFEYMPELGWRWGYAAVWAVMLVLAGAMVLWFRSKRWW